MRSVRSWSWRWRKRVPLSYVRTNLPDQRGSHLNQLTLSVPKGSPRVEYCNAVLRYADSQVDRLVRHRTTGGSSRTLYFRGWTRILAATS